MRACSSKAAATPWQRASSSSGACRTVSSPSWPSASLPPVAAASTNRTLALDGALSAGGANLELIELLEQAGPYGPGHPEPRFVFPAHRLSRVRLLKEAHIRCTLQASDGARLEACAFRVGDTPLAKLLLQSEGLPLHVAGHVRRASWNGRESIELIIEDAADPRAALR